MKQTEIFRVNSHDTDGRGEARPSVLLRYIQETANLQHLRYGPTTDELRQQGIAFIISRVSLRIYGTLHAFDTVTAESWLGAIRGYRMERYGRLLWDGERIAELSAQWAAVDIPTGTLIKADGLPLGFGTDEPLAMGAPGRLKIPAEATLTPTVIQRVRYGDADQNGHLNNTHYPDLLWDALPLTGGERMAQIEISYLKEARQGTAFQVFCGAYDGAWYLRTALEDGATGAEAMIRTI